MSSAARTLRWKSSGCATDRVAVKRWYLLLFSARRGYDFYDFIAHATFGTGSDHKSIGKELFGLLVVELV